ncbi:MAG: transposase [Chloroflexi bacterium]|nr:transposase [Chloroflexota bacterium]
MRQLALQSGHSRPWLYRLIDSFLADTPTTPTLEPQPAQYLLFDGTFLHRPHSIVVLMDGQTHTLVRGQFGVRENSELELRAFFEPMMDKGLQPRSFTVDGNRQVIRALKILWPDAVIQRCLVHIQRQGLSWCRNSPKTPYARQLRQIFLRVSSVDTASDRETFFNLVTTWEARHGAEIAARKETGRVFGDVKRARSMLLRALSRYVPLHRRPTHLDHHQRAGRVLLPPEIALPPAPRSQPPKGDQITSPGTSTSRPGKARIFGH